MPLHESFRGATLEAWFQRLNLEGFRVGIRERLSVHHFLLLRADTTAESLTERDALEWLTPLLCGTLEEQRRYGEVLSEFLAEAPSKRETAPVQSTPKPPPIRPPPPTVALIAAGFLLLVCIGGFWQQKRPSGFTPIINPLAQGQRSQTNPSGIKLDSGAKPVVPGSPGSNTVPIVFNSTHTFRPPGVLFQRPVAGITGIISVACGCLLLAQWLGWMRRRPYLRQVRTDQNVESRMLRDPHPQEAALPKDRLPLIARGLRHRTEGTRQTLDIRATIRRTVSGGGVLHLVYRRLHSTPEYAALIDRRHLNDHFAELCLGMIRGLVNQGVVVDAYAFEESPEFGCWPLGTGKTLAFSNARIGLGEFSALHDGRRLLVFSEASSLIDPFSGQPRNWTRQLAPVGERAWFTPMPMGSWGSAEDAADALGFLILPAQPESWFTWIDWLAAQSPRLDTGPDWPMVYPSLLKDEAIFWVGRQAPPPDDTYKQLLYELRSYLGPLRFQWLCACAIFPALSSPLTLALGRQLTEDLRELSLGMAALAALPFFRYGQMPDWLRPALVERIHPEHEGQFRAVIERKLDRAITVNGGTDLVEVAWRRWVWFRQGKGFARDRVLVEFLQRDRVTRLAQRLPERLRRQFFRDGLSIRGLRPGVLLACSALLMASLIVAVGWQRIAPRPLSVTVNAFTNQMGMKFVPVSGTQVLFCIWETRVGDFEAFVKETGYDATSEMYSFRADGWKQRGDTWKSPGFNQNKNHPVCGVSYNDAVAFCEWLTKKEGRKYRLPSDAEWSAAVSPGQYPWGDQWPPPTGAGNYAGSEAADSNWPTNFAVISGFKDAYPRTAPVGQFLPNGFGLFDMGGNVWEWCGDFYRKEMDSVDVRKKYPELENDGGGNTYRVLRGGSWFGINPEYLLSSYRNGNEPGDRYVNVGFRCVVEMGGAAR